MGKRAKRILTYGAVVLVFGVTFRVGVLENPDFTVREFCMSMTSELAGLVFAITLLEMYINQKQGRDPGARRRLARRETELFAAALADTAGLVERHPDGEQDGMTPEERLVFAGRELRRRGERLLDAYCDELEPGVLEAVHYVLAEGELLRGLERLVATGQPAALALPDDREREILGELATK